MLSHQGVEIVERIKRIRMCDFAEGRFRKHIRARCHHVPNHDDDGLGPHTGSKPPKKCFPTVSALITVSLHSNTTGAKTKITVYKRKGWLLSLDHSSSI